MCTIFKRGIALHCQLCSDLTIHLLQKIINCKKAKYQCCLCGKMNGLRLVTVEKVQVV